jgi:hypothetical protein
MNSCISRILVPLGRAWHRFAHDDQKRRAAVRHTKTSKWTICIFTVKFLRQDYVLLLWRPSPRSCKKPQRHLLGTPYVVTVVEATALRCFPNPVLHLNFRAIA